MPSPRLPSCATTSVSFDFTRRMMPLSPQTGHGGAPVTGGGASSSGRTAPQLPQVTEPEETIAHKCRDGVRGRGLQTPGGRRADTAASLQEQESLSICPRLSSWTNSTRLSAGSAYCCFSMAKQAPRQRWARLLVLVQCSSVRCLSRDACLGGYAVARGVS
jgi:hypothetical protein